MFTHDLGASLYKTWTTEQRRDEIGKLVEGYRGGTPLGIVCNLAEIIAGSRELAKEYLIACMPLAERQAAVAKETGGMRSLLKEFLL